MTEEWIYENEKDNNVRYVLGTKGKKTLCCIGINPSIAEPNHLDNTMKAVKKISENNGYDSFIMFNVYPVRSTKFENLSQKESKEYIDKNIKEIVKVIKNLPQPINVWIAYGDLINNRKYTRTCFNDLKKILDQYNCKYWHGGLTKTGNPRHPLYLSRQIKLEEYQP